MSTVATQDPVIPHDASVAEVQKFQLLLRRKARYTALARAHQQARAAIGDDTPWFNAVLEEMFFDQQDQIVSLQKQIDELKALFGVSEGQQ
jgi:hypothetical protein